MKPSPEMPSDLNREGRKKWRELVQTCDDVDPEALAHYCRQYVSLIEIRSEKQRQQAAGMFQAMVPGRDGSVVLNPLTTQETRLLAALNRQLKSLGLNHARDSKGRSSMKGDGRPPGMTGPEPPWGWNIEALLGSVPLPNETK